MKWTPADENSIFKDMGGIKCYPDEIFFFLNKNTKPTELGVSFYTLVLYAIYSFAYFNLIRISKYSMSIVKV